MWRRRNKGKGSVEEVGIQKTGKGKRVRSQCGEKSAEQQERRQTDVYNS